MSGILALFLLFAGVPAVHASQLREVTQISANPIRKVVNMLSAMQTRVTEEGKKELEMHEKFMCSCKTGKADLEKSIASYEGEVPEKASEIDEKTAKLAQTKEDLKTAQADRTAAKASMAEGTKLREKQAVEYATEAAEQSANIEALKKAVAAISEGMSAGAFLQTSAAQFLKTLVTSRQELDDVDRSDILAFLQGEEGNEYAPASGEIVGILKSIGEKMSKAFADAESEEQDAVKAYGKMVAAKKKEVAALTEQIEKKSVSIGDLGVEIAMLKSSLKDTEKQLVEDKAFLAKLNTDCSTAQKDYDALALAQSQELTALAETIKMLSDDDALELFKKTLPGAGASFTQMLVTTTSMRTRALDILRELKQNAHSDRHHIDFISLALHGKKIGFEKIVKMIDDLITSLKEEQSNDDHKLEFCETQFELMAEKKTALKGSIEDVETFQTEKDESISALADEMKALGESISALDKSVAEATAMRKAENEDLVTLVAQDSAAIELLGLAKKRLQKFYQPSLVSMAQVDEVALVQVSRNNKEDASGVLHMIDLLVKDLETEVLTAKAEEKNAQEDYEVLMADAKEKRAGDVESLTNKQSAKADLDSDLQALSSDLDSKQKEFAGVVKVTAALHADCDFLTKYYDVRKTARTEEMDSLSKAKAVLSGADYSLVQLVSRKRKFLSRA